MKDNETQSKDRRVTVPVMVDARRQIDDVGVVRAVYLIITADAPVPGGVVEPDTKGARAIPILGHMGVIYRPDSGSHRFTSRAKIERLFTTLEETLGYTVELEDIWIPAYWFRHRAEVSRREVYRLDLDLFQACYRYREGTFGDIEELVALSPTGRQLRYSPRETEAFHRWNQQQIDDAREIYPKNEALALAWVENKQYD